ncbi:MAG: GNAT family N-acetyltransferase [Anaerolineales bacterium]
MSEVKHHPDEGRFTIKVDGYNAVLTYHMDGNTIVFTHTGVPEAIGGRGIGSQLASAGLKCARAQGHRVRPLCWFVAGYIQRHPEYQDLLDNA